MNLRVLGRLPLAMVITLALLVAACTAGPGPSRAPTVTPPASMPSSEVPAPSHAPEPSEPSTEPMFGFEPASVPPADNSSAITVIARSGDELVAIGFDGGFGSLLWTSADEGRSWIDITPDDFASIGIASVVEFDGMLVGVGRGDTIDIEAEQAAVHVSEDGSSWRRVGSAEQLVGQMIDVIATDDGLFAVGGVPGADSAGVWHSADAETWTRVGGDLEHAFLWSIAEGGPGLVAVGWRRNPEPDLGVWTSADAGQTWELAPDPDGFAGFEATDVVALPDGTLVMTGSAFDGSAGRMWASTDGLSWRLVHESPDGAYARSLALTPAGVIAVGGDREMQARAWISADGVDWSTFGPPLEAGFFSGSFATTDGLLFVGSTQSGTVETGIEAHAAVWVVTHDD